MKVRVLKEYVGHGSGRLHKVGEVEEWAKLGTYSRALIENGFVEVVDDTEEPLRGEYYYFVSGSGTVSEYIWDGDDVDRNHKEFGNLYRTEEEAQRALAWLKAVKVLRRDSQKSMAHASPTVRFYVWLNFSELTISALLTRTGRRSCQNPFPFANEDDTKASIEAHAEEWKTFFGVSG